MRREQINEKGHIQAHSILLKMEKIRSLFSFSSFPQNNDQYSTKFDNIWKKRTWCVTNIRWQVSGIEVWHSPFQRVIYSLQYAIKVKALIDAGTCASVSTTTICGSTSQSYSYYETFIYKTYRVVIVSGVPNHAAEYNQTKVNPNTRCQFTFN